MTTPKPYARLHNLIWALIYLGLLTLGLGLATQRSDDTLGTTLALVGGVTAAVGVGLIYVRSRLPKKD